MKNKTKKRRSEHGNVLFLILIAVALFAALSYVVTQSSRSGSGNIGKEDAKLAAAEILNYVTSVQTAVQTLMLRRECGINKLTFDNPFDNNAHVNPNAPATMDGESRSVSSLFLLYGLRSHHECRHDLRRAIVC